MEKLKQHSKIKLTSESEFSAEAGKNEKQKKRKSDPWHEHAMKRWAEEEGMDANEILKL